MKVKIKNYLNKTTQGIGLNRKQTTSITLLVFHDKKDLLKTRIKLSRVAIENEYHNKSPMFFAHIDFDPAEIMLHIRSEKNAAHGLIHGDFGKTGIIVAMSANQRKLIRKILKIKHQRNQSISES